MTELRVSGLSLQIGEKSLLREVELQLAADQRCALLGPSGSGKTLLLRALVGLIPPGARLSGHLSWAGNTLDLSRSGSAATRRGLGLVFQGAGQALHPLRRIGDLLTETVRAHGGGDPRDLLVDVGLTPVEQYWQRRPDQLSGGQRQRALIALTLAAKPTLLLADEPTAALDSVARAQILALIRRLCGERGLGLLLVAHDPALVRQVCDKALVLVDGEVVERGELSKIYAQPGHRWTQSLVAAQSRLEHIAAPAAASPATCLAVQQLGVQVPSQRWRKPPLTLLQDIGFQLGAGERVALMGASGSGKSTLGRCLVGLLQPSSGQISWAGNAAWRSAAARAATVQMVLQDSRAALNPSHSIETSLREARQVQSGNTRALTLGDVCALTEVEPSWLRRRPASLSGGQCQRVALARALIVQPQLLILDEALSALDPPLRVDLLEQLERLSDQLGLALLLITHDFSETRRLCQRALILDQGQLVEEGLTAELEHAPNSSATAALVKAWRESHRSSALSVS